MNAPDPNQAREDARIASAAKRLELKICAENPAGIRAALVQAIELVDEVEADPDHAIAGWVGGHVRSPGTWSQAIYEHAPTSPYFPSDPRRS